MKAESEYSRGRVSTCFAPSKGTKGLWSVSMKMCFPMMKVENFSHAHVVVRASFSIGA